MKILITPEEVAVLAFGGDRNLAGFASDSAIVAAERRFIRPVLGGKLWSAVEQGLYETLVEEYVKPALALYVKYIVLPSIASQTGLLGVVQYGGQNFGGAGADSLALLRKEVKAEADTLMRVCSEHLNAAVGYERELPAGVRGCLNFATEDILLRFACFPPSRLGHSSKLDGSRLGVGSGSDRGLFSSGEGGVVVPTASETREKSTGSESERPRAANSKQPLSIGVEYRNDVAARSSGGYPDYDPEQNVLNRVSTVGGVVI